MTFGGKTALYESVELEELRSFLSDPADGEAFATFVHELKAIDDGARLVPTGPRLTRGRYGT